MNAVIIDVDIVIIGGKLNFLIPSNDPSQVQSRVTNALITGGPTGLLCAVLARQLGLTVSVIGMYFNNLPILTHSLFSMLIHARRET